MNTKIKILNLPIGSAYGGITRYFLENWKYINKEKFQYDVVTMQNNLEYERELTENGTKVYHMCRAEDNKEQFIKEAEEILDNGYDIVHIHTSFWKSFIFEECAKRKGVKKIIIHAHNTDVSRTDNMILLDKMRKQHNVVKERINPNIATDYWACSWEAADWLYGDKISRNNIKIVIDDIDIDRFCYDPSIREEYRKVYNLNSKYVIGHIGRFTYQKNQKFLIDVFNVVHKIRENSVLLLEGIGDRKDEMVNYVKLLELQDDVIFMEKRKDVECLYQAMDVFAFPSRYEGLGRVLIEAQTSGLQCFSSDKVPQIAKVTDNISYLPLEKECWINALLNLEEYTRKDMSAQVKLCGYNIKENIKKLENLYLEGLESYV